MHIYMMLKTEQKRNHTGGQLISAPNPLHVSLYGSIYAICFTVSINRRAGTSVHSDKVSLFSRYDPYMDRLT